MVRTASSSTSSGQAPALTAVATIPLPSGLVSTRSWPGRARSMESIRPGSTSPTATIPYLGSASSIECPPTTGMPASRAFSAPPRMISSAIPSGSSFRGNERRFSANRGRPPMAYTSERAFAAAICPKSQGSSTIGVK